MADNIVKFLKSKDYVMVNDHLGHGSFGKTVLLQDPFIDELFVAKKYEPEYLEIKERFFSSFLQEIKILYKLNHPNIVRIYNYYAYEEHYTGYILMEFIDGQTIGDHFKNYTPSLTEGDPNSVFMQLISAFRCLESNNIIHRDIREGNIMVDGTGNVKVIDFGLGKFFVPCDIQQDSLHSEVNRTGLDKLPAEYYAGEYSSQTDMFYLAEMFNRLLQTYNLSNGFIYQHILNKMLETEAAKRYSTFDEIAGVLSKRRLEVKQFSEGDKHIYRDFSESLLGTIHVYIGERIFQEDTTIFIQKLGTLLEHNLLADYVQNNQELVRTMVLSKCEYYLKKKIGIVEIKKFYDWYISLDEDTQKLVIKNLINKLSSIKVEPFVEIPY